MTKGNHSKDTFVTITNRDIFLSINETKQSITDGFKKNEEEHLVIKGMIEKNKAETEGKLRLAKWIGVTALSLTILLIGYFLKSSGVATAILGIK